MNIALILFLLAISYLPVYAHPGRLNEKGCHRVMEDWQYADGRTLKAGTEHCHRGLGIMALDGKEMLQDNADVGRSVKEIKQQARDNACMKAALEVLIDYEKIMSHGKGGDVILLREIDAIHKRTKAVLKECDVVRPTKNSEQKKKR